MNWEPLPKAEITRLYHSARPDAGAVASDVLLEGPKLFREALRYPERIKAVYASEPLPDLDLPARVKRYVVKAREGKSITHLEQFPGIACRLELRYAERVGANENAVFLHQIQDAGNAGTIIRTADWFGVQKVVASGSVSLFNQKLVQASMGSVLRVGMVKNLDLFHLAGTHQIYISDLEGMPVEEVAVKAPWVLCIGNESRGTEGLEVAGAPRITIPRVGSGIDSLNAAISCGILLDRFRTGCT